MAIKEQLSAFNSQVIPFFIVILVPTNASLWEIKIIYMTSIISAATVSVLVFVHWKKGPIGWQRIAPYLFFIFTLFNYFFCPGMQIFSILYMMLHDTYDGAYAYLDSYFIFFLVLMSLRLFEFFTQVWPVI